MQLSDPSVLVELLRVQSDPAAILSVDGQVRVSSRAFDRLVHPDFLDDRVQRAVALSLRSDGAVPVRLLSQDGAFRSGFLSLMQFGAERVIHLRVREARSEFTKLTKRLDRINAEISRKSRDEITLRQVLDATVEGILVCDADGGILETNYAMDQMVGKITKLDEIFPGTAWRGFLDDSSIGSIGGEGLRLTIRTPTGDERVVDMNVGRSRSIDSVIYVLVFHDRTDRTQLERAVRAVEEADSRADLARTRDKAKTRFLGMISHELRTPLHGVMSALELMDMHGIDDAELRSLFDIALRASEAALEQVNRVLEITRFETRVGSEMVEDPFDPGELVRSVIDQQRAFATKMTNLVTFSQSGLKNACVAGDAYLFRQIVQNLIGNALKFTRNGSVNVRLDATGLHDGRVRLDLTVADTGVGFDIAQKERLLREFETGNDRYSKIEDGAGIGLSLVNRAINRMNGVLDISSVPGRGSAFRVIVDLQPGVMHVSLPDPMAQARPVFGLHVLVVDDGEINRAVLAKMLEGMGCRVDLAENGATALQHLSSERFDLVFMDISMPDIDGIEVTRRFKSKQPDNPVPIAGLTAHSDPETRDICLEAGMVDVLVKPLRKAKLQEFLSEISAKTKMTQD